MPPPVAATSGESAPVPEASPRPPAPLPELSPQGLALLQRIAAQVPDIDRLPGLRHALATLISRSDLTPQPTSAAPSLHAKELELLRRRASKLVRELRTVRTEVRRVADREEIDTGVASRYREVQGLGGEGPAAEAKRGMLEDIFRANLELRREAG